MMIDIPPQASLKQVDLLVFSDLQGLRNLLFLVLVYIYKNQEIGEILFCQG